MKFKNFAIGIYYATLAVATVMCMVWYRGIVKNLMKTDENDEEPE